MKSVKTGSQKAELKTYKPFYRSALNSHEFLNRAISEKKRASPNQSAFYRGWGCYLVFPIIPFAGVKIAKQQVLFKKVPLLNPALACNYLP